MTAAPAGWRNGIFAPTVGTQYWTSSGPQYGPAAGTYPAGHGASPTPPWAGIIPPEPPQNPGTGTPTGTTTSGAPGPPAGSTGSSPQPPNGPAYTQGPFASDSLAAALMASSPGADQGQAAQAAASPTAGRFSQPPASSSAGMTSDVWVTVPVDKVEVRNGKGTVTPLYADAVGYRNTGQGRNIPPTPAAGRP